jgi:predicted P-loop ATPase
VTVPWRNPQSMCVHPTLLETVVTVSETIMPNNLVPFPPPGTEPPGAEEHARAETERKRRLFAWADRVLQELGFAERLANANSLGELRKITFDVDAAEVALAIREALHPASGVKADCFAGLREGGLKRILTKRFDEMKAERVVQLRSQGGRQQSTLDWTDELKLDDKGGVRPILSNLILYLRHHPKWEGVLAYDEFNARVVIRKRPPWGEEVLDTPWTDHHEALTRVWFQREDIIGSLGDVGRAVQAAARGNPFHPVREYFDALVWDGTPRVDTWLVTYFHADDSAYIRAVGRRYLISAAARIYKPGCKVDHMLILEGPQGKQKSEALRTLAIKDAWFSDRLSHMASKDAAIEVAGVLLFEMAEMDALTRASSSTAKAFLTRRHDRFRPPHGKHTISLPRQCVFAGTINPPVGGYLKDSTGARRFWPVACRGMIDRDGLERDRDQLLAEAVHRYQAGQKWWLETPELEALATAEQATRFKSDVWKEPIKQWIGARTHVTIDEVLRGALGIKPSNPPDHSAEIRVANILKGIGFKQYMGRRGIRRQRTYKRPIDRNHRNQQR